MSESVNLSVDWPAFHEWWEQQTAADPDRLKSRNHNASEAWCAAWEAATAAARPKYPLQLESMCLRLAEQVSDLLTANVVATANESKLQTLIGELSRALVVAAMPLEVLAYSEKAYGEIDGISPSLRTSIADGLTAARAGVAAATASNLATGEKS